MAKGKAKAAQEEVEAYNLFQCQDCEDKPEFAPNELRQHLKVAHGVETTQGQRKGLMFIDGKEFWRNTYEWEIGGVTLVQVVQGKRSKSDMMAW